MITHYQITLIIIIIINLITEQLITLTTKQQHLSLHHQMKQILHRHQIKF